MSGHQFTFPPPPPAPPKATSSYPGAPQPFAMGIHGFKGRRGGGSRKNYGDRGHRRGFDRGRGRSGHFGFTQSASSYGNPSLGIDQRRSSLPDVNYSVQTSDYRTSGHPLPCYPPDQLSQFPNNVLHSYEPQKQDFPPNARPSQAVYPANGSGSYQNLNGQYQCTSHDHGHSLPTLQTPLPAAQNNNSFRTNMQAIQPVLMGPPIRMGFDPRRSSSQAQQYGPPTTKGIIAHQHELSNGSEAPYQHDSRMGVRSGSHASLDLFPGNRSRGQRREHGDIYNRTRDPNQRSQAAPAVPSFGIQLPLPLKPPALHENTRKSRKKKRKLNQLGLTPKAEEHESSEEDDTDEEAKLASAASSAGQGHQLLQFNYKGRTSILQSSSDITAWIEERKKNFPTRARAAEMTKARRQQRAADQIPPKAQEKDKGEVQKVKRQDTETKIQQKRVGTSSEDVAARSKRKIEKLRKRLEKEEERIAEAEAHASKDKIEHGIGIESIDVSALDNEDKERKRSGIRESSNVEIEDTNQMKPKHDEPPSMVPDPLTPTSQPALADDEHYPLPKTLNADDHVNSSTGQDDDEASASQLDRFIHESDVSTPESSSDSTPTDSEDSTSSGGSSSEGNSDNGAPDETSIKRDRPERIALPNRGKPKQICRAFLHKGSCKRGSCCKYLHELPGRDRRKKISHEVKRTEGRKERVGLYQRLVKQEKEQEDRNVIEAIVHLGEKGFLEDCVKAVNGDRKVT